MTAKLRLLCAALALALVSARPMLPAATEAGISPSAMPEIVQVRCARGAGTAFYVGPDILLSVAHVTTLPGCRAGGKAFEVIGQRGDFSILRVAEPVKRWLQIDCSGFQPGEVYTGWGFARGLPTLTSVDAEAKGEDRNGFARLWGVFHVIPGQSGGPFIKEGTRKVTGTVNVYDHRAGDSGSMELRRTALCAGVV